MSLEVEITYDNGESVIMDNVGAVHYSTVKENRKSGTAINLSKASEVAEDGTMTTVPAKSVNVLDTAEKVITEDRFKQVLYYPNGAEADGESYLMIIHTTTY